jgi:hypothetical protein
VQHASSPRQLIPVFAQHVPSSQAARSLFASQHSSSAEHESSVLKQHNPPAVAKAPVTSPGQQSVAFAAGSPAGMQVVPSTQLPSRHTS